VRIVIASRSVETSPANLSGKTCVVTGASSGIGLETARALAAMGASVLLVCRDPARGSVALAEVRRAGPSGAHSVVLADLSSQAEVRRAAAEILATHPRLDVLVNNAGVIMPEREVTVDGLEHTFATNHLAYFLLTTLLLDALRAAAPSRIVNVSSEAHRRTTLDFDDLQSTRDYRGFRVYGRSKLANVIFTYELARRLATSGVTANCLHPGVVGSNFAQSRPGIVRTLFRIGRPFLLTPERGARTSIHVASAPELATTTGLYFDRETPRPSSRASYDVTSWRRLWLESEKLTGLEPTLLRGARRHRRSRYDSRSADLVRSVLSLGARNDIAFAIREVEYLVLAPELELITIVGRLFVEYLAAR
jgi:retinol dehydrogenase-12